VIGSCSACQKKDEGQQEHTEDSEISYMLVKCAGFRGAEEESI